MDAKPKLLAVETGAVGVILLIVFIVIHLILMAIDKDFSMSHTGIFLNAFLAGAAGHLLMEAAGANKLFIKTRMNQNNW